MNKRILAEVSGAIVVLFVGLGVGASGKTVTKTATVKVPGPTVTKTVTVTVPGPTVTKDVPTPVCVAEVAAYEAAVGVTDKAVSQTFGDLANGNDITAESDAVTTDMDEQNAADTAMANCFKAAGAFGTPA